MFDFLDKTGLKTVLEQIKAKFPSSPVKSVQVVGTTDGIGNFILWHSSENRKPVFITFADHCAIPFLSSNGNYYAHVLSAATDEQLTNTAVTATVFYIEI